MSTDDTSISLKEIKRYTGGLTPEQVQALPPADKKRVTTRAVERILRSQMSPEERVQEALGNIADKIKSKGGQTR